MMHYYRAAGATRHSVRAQQDPGGALQDWIDLVNSLSPVAFYRLEQTGGTTAVDSTANSNDGTHNGGVTVGASPILPAGGDAAASYDGSDDYTSLPVNLWSTAWSVGFWMQASAQDNKFFWAEGNSGSDLPIVALSSGTTSIGQNTSKVRFFIRDNNGDEAVDAQPTIETLDGTTHYYGLSYDNGAWALYIDGSEDISGSVSHPSISVDRAGLAALLRTGVAAYAACILDEVHLHTSALTAQNWADLYAAATG